MDSLVVYKLFVIHWYRCEIGSKLDEVYNADKGSQAAWGFALVYNRTKQHFAVDILINPKSVASSIDAQDASFLVIRNQVDTGNDQDFCVSSFTNLLGS